MSRTVHHVLWQRRRDDVPSAHTSHTLIDPRTGAVHRFAAYAYPRALGYSQLAARSRFTERATRASVRRQLRSLRDLPVGSGYDDADVAPTRHRHRSRRETV